ncbi:SMI1 / KNR4 family protein [Bacillus sp. AFS001701]|uniref:SMI1/KNR4 family protein n=1 Tax=Bacillus sp. AFS001701 TaxID=2033480 RepID=UPI000BF4E884|nr:SMI1/KNR4 family protein [Bacillus sp. AFS001701]PET60306.1 SMI1 / KNR4 family protein [Bacillus sp. AFS001701]
MNLSNLNIDIINKGASKKEVYEVEQEMNCALPAVYTNLLQHVNGFLTDEGVLIYGTQELVERNLTYEVSEYASGYVAIGDDSGGTVFLMLQGKEGIQLITVDVGDMNPTNGIVLSSDLYEWITVGCPLLE